jgi:hypothetical protein
VIGEQQYSKSKQKPLQTGEANNHKGKTKTNSTQKNQTVTNNPADRTTHRTANTTKNEPNKEWFQ